MELGINIPSPWFSSIPTGWRTLLMSLKAWLQLLLSRRGRSKKGSIRLPQPKLHFLFETETWTAPLLFKALSLPRASSSMTGPGYLLETGGPLLFLVDSSRGLSPSTYYSIDSKLSLFRVVNTYIRVHSSTFPFLTISFSISLLNNGNWRSHSQMNEFLASIIESLFRYWKMREQIRCWWWPYPLLMTWLRSSCESKLSGWSIGWGWMGVAGSSNYPALSISCSLNGFPWLEFLHIKEILYSNAGWVCFSKHAPSLSCGGGGSILILVVRLIKHGFSGFSPGRLSPVGIG